MLDNCEQLLGPVATLAERVLSECPGVRILATSREGLGVGGEHVWPLRSLPLPLPDAAGTTTSDAVVLFAERAEAARATFTLDGSNAGAVAEICRRLDGIPLAIELAAARVVSMTPSKIAGCSTNASGSYGDVVRVERHQTLRATVDWSYRCSATGTSRVRASQLFAGTEARAAAAAGDRRRGRSLGCAERAHRAGGEVDDRHRRHPRGHDPLPDARNPGQYARERLDEHGDSDRWRRRHAEYFADWAETPDQASSAATAHRWKREKAELDNLRAAVT